MYFICNHLMQFIHCCTVKSDPLRSSSLKYLKGRKMFSEKQAQVLFEYLEKNPYPDMNDKIHLAKMINESTRRISKWFAQKRCKTRRPCKSLQINRN